MTTKYTLEDINDVLNEFCESTYKHWGTYSYATGTLQQTLVTLLSDAPKHKQAEVLSNLKALTVKYSKEKVAV